MRNLNQKGNITIIVGVFILLLILGAGIYYLLTQKSQPTNQSQNSQTQLPSTSPTSNQVTQRLTGSFQEIMENHCKVTKTMRIEDLPVSIVPTVISKISNQTESPVGCQHKLEPMTWNAAVYNDKSYTSLYISDNSSTQAGPTYKKLIKNSGDIKISIWYQDNPYNAENDTIRGLGEKDLRLSNGEVVYVKFELALMDKSNPKFSKLKSSSYGSEVVNNTTVDTALYADLTKASPEKDNLALIEEVLQGITPK